MIFRSKYLSSRIVFVSIWVLVLVTVLSTAEAAEPDPDLVVREMPELPGFHAQSDDVYLATFEEENDVGQGLLSTAISPVATRALDAVALPFGEAAFKFEVDETGIYEVTYTELQNAGMNVAAVNPLTFEMMHRGASVSYQFVGDGDVHFELGESIRFYGESVFNFPRAERQHLNYNVYWLWANGTPSLIGTGVNPIGNPVDNSWRSTVTLEEENHWFSTWSDDWDLFPNDADAWFMDRLIKGSEARITGTYSIDLPHPYALGSAAELTVEVNSRSHTYVSGIPHQNKVEVFLNDAATPNATDGWWSIRNRNIVGNVPAFSLNNGSNDVHIAVVGETNNTAAGKSYIYPNRITVAYDRTFQADNNELIFIKDTDTSLEFHISGYTEPDFQKYLVWDTTYPLNPVRIPVTATDLVAGTLRIGSNLGTSNKFIATTKSNTHSVVTISPYTAYSIEPAGGAEWLAISYGAFMTATESLAMHRQDPLYGGLTTFVVDVEDVINQFGYGLPLPDGIRDYLLQSLGWVTPPKYVTLVGDATINPRKLTCVFGCPAGFNDHEENYVPTFLSFVDRFQGMIPTDPVLVTFGGYGSLPALPLGRIPVKTAQEAEDFIAKVIQYEQNQLTPQAWMENILFVSDDADGGGDFCAESLSVGGELPASFSNTYLCLDDLNATDLRTEMFANINDTGTLIMNYRGHGSIGNWANGALMNTVDATNFNNDGNPLVVLSADCLDGYFALPGNEALSEAILQKANAGTAAHWSSSGLGYGVEHNVLHTNFYTGLFEHGHTAIGDAIQYAKSIYFAQDKHPSELYAFTLQGDPAMQLMRPDYVLDKTAPVAGVEPGGQTDFILSLTNDNIYPISGVITDSLPVGYNFVSASSAVGITTSVVGQEVAIELHDPLAYQDTVAVTLVAQLDDPYAGISPMTNMAGALAHYGIDQNLLDNYDNEAVTVCAAGTVPTLPTVAIGESGNNVVLTWAGDAGATSFDVYRSVGAPYFDPTTVSPIGNVGSGGTSYTDNGKIGNPSLNHYYVITANGCGGAVALNSNRIGEFDFAIVAGTP